MARSTHTQYYSNFVGLDASSDPRAVSRNRLAYLVNMWRDYESEQGAAVETFPGFRRVAHSLGFDAEGDEIGAVHGLYHFRSRKGKDYVVVHAGTKIYAFENNALASGDYEKISERSAIISEGVADRDSTGFIYNNNLYILDGDHYLTVTTVDGETSDIKASAVDAYVPTTYYNGNLYEQRNMLTTTARQTETGSGKSVAGKTYDDIVEYATGYLFGWKSDVELLTLFWDGTFAATTNTLKIGPERTGYQSFHNSKSLKYVYITDKYFYNSEGDDWSTIHSLIIEERCFYNCKNLKEIYLNIHRFDDSEYITFEAECLSGCDNLKRIFINSTFKEHINGWENIPDGVEIIYQGYTEFDDAKFKHFADEDTKTFTVQYPIYEAATGVRAVYDGDGNEILACLVDYKEVEINKEKVRVVSSISLRAEDVQNEDGTTKEINIDLELHPAHFTTIKNIKNFSDGNTDYKGTTIDAVNGCTKSAVFDGRVFLTGNPELPNTVFYSHRNLTGANDPTYFGIYNYFNDGEGNTPNVDILSTPSMLMVLKGNTVQDGSIYYHQGVSNEDEETMDIIPRLYPSTQGAAGLGSAGDTVPSRLSCNFLDDPVFISKRGLEAVGKETVNLERTIQHRSSNIDRLLIREDLTRASLAEWKGYLVVCCNGHVYLADSRYMTQHLDGSYQYEWYYLEGVGTYEAYTPVWKYLEYNPIIEPLDLEPLLLGDFMLVGGHLVNKEFKWHDDDAKLESDAEVYNATIYHPADDGYKMNIYYVIKDGFKYIVEANGEEKRGIGRFFGASQILTVGDRLIFGTNNGDICIINTDMRGKSVGDRFIEYDKIDRSFYSFNGVAYKSGCSVKLDDCDAKSLSKTTVCGTTTARFKMMPGSHCTAMVSTNGRDWQKLGEAFSSRFDFSDIEFSNMSFAENENNVVVFPEISRGWVNKQYYFYSDRFEAPFGLYELSYLWYVSGKIRY